MVDAEAAIHLGASAGAPSGKRAANANSYGHAAVMEHPAHLGAAGTELRLDCGEAAVLPENNRIESERDRGTNKGRITMTKSTEMDTLERNSAANQAGTSLQTTAE